jgi:hypothetical protein
VNPGFRLVLVDGGASADSIKVSGGIVLKGEVDSN